VTKGLFEVTQGLPELISNIRPHITCYGRPV